MKTRNDRYKSVTVSALSVLLLSVPPAFSEESQTPYYATKSQADAGYVAALHQSDVVSERLQTLMNNVRNSETHLQNMEVNGTSSQVHMAEQDLHRAESTLLATMSQMSGISVSDIEAMHDSGMSWAQMKGEMGLLSYGNNAFSNTDHNSMSTTGGSNSHTGRTKSGTMAMNSNSGSGMNSVDSETHGSNQMSAASAAGLNQNNGNPSAKNNSFYLGHLSPMATGSNYNHSMDSDDQALMANTDRSYHDQNDMVGYGVGMAEMDVATMRDTMNGGVSGHGTDMDTSIDHEPGDMMSGAGGLSSGMSADSGMDGGKDSGGMGGNSGGGMGSSGGGMGDTGGTGNSGGGMGGGSSSGGSGGGHGNGGGMM